MEAVVDDLNLSFLLDHERERILKVLEKDEKLRKREEKRIRRLKNELLEMRNKGSRRPQELGDRQCARCLRTLGIIFGRGDLCEECQLRVCGDCRVRAPNSRRWKCSVCAKISELSLASGAWFLEERSKRFEQGPPGSEVIKQTILSSPKAQEKPAEVSETLDLGPKKVTRLNVVEAPRRKGKKKVDKKGGRPTQKPEKGVDSISVKSLPNGENAQSVRSAQSSHSNSGGATALESSEALSVCDNPRPEALNNSSTPSDNRRVRPDGAECVSPEKRAAGQLKTDSGTPVISVSRASLSSAPDPNHSEGDASAPEPSDDAPCVRSGSSVPGLNETEVSDEDAEEDIDALMSAHSKSADRRLSNAVSTSSINSTMSMYSETGDYGNAWVSGEVLLNITYSYKTGALNITVKECRNLATGDERRQRTDPYVKTYLLPDLSRQSKRKTSIKSNTINPVFNENLRYVISHSLLQMRTLQVTVWHHDRFGHNVFLGEVELSFDSWEFNTQAQGWYTLQPKSEPLDSTLHYKGELTVVLKYIPAEKNPMLPVDQVQVKKSFLKGKKTSSFTPPKGGMVELLVKGATNLVGVKSGGTSDPFVKGYLLPDSTKSTKHKTAVERHTVNPQWNHTFTYCGLQPGDLNNVCLELTVWDKEPLASNVFLGGVRLGAGSGKSYGNEVDWMDSYGEEQRVWQHMIENPEVPQECTLMLRSNMRKHEPD